MAIDSKKAFVFSMLAFFLSFLIFAYALSNFDPQFYTKEKDFVESRVLAIDRELTYFTDSYLPSIISFSGYNSVQALIEYSSVSYDLEDNYGLLNSRIREGMVQGTFSGSPQPSLADKNLEHLSNIYINDFNTNFKANMEVEFHDLLVYERTPYHLNFRLNSTITVTTIDNISSWEFTDVRDVIVPMFNITDPKFYFNLGQEYTLRPADLFTSSIDWTSTTLNDTIVEVYGSVYFDPEMKYTIGNSLVDRILNISESSYQEVLLFLSFDHDIDEGRIYDTVDMETQIEMVSLSSGILPFLDITNYYRNSKHGLGLLFDGEDNYLRINEHSINSNLLDGSFTIEIWFYPYKEYYDNEVYLFHYDNEIAISIEETSLIISDGNSFSYSYDLGIIEPRNYYLNLQRDDSTGNFRLFVNSQEIFDSTLVLNSQLNGGDIFLGSYDGSSGGTDFFYGIIDEVKIYSRIMSEQEILRNYYNYGSSAKGCCNYITLINPNLMGFNNPSFEDLDLSYSSHLFFKYLQEGFEPEITLYDLTNFTRTEDYSHEYYNFRFDFCMMQAFNVFDFDIDPGPQIHTAHPGTNTCPELIRLGLY